ncbi:hypothetical protein BGZ72_004397 [Mortierella alpina]|nr:hypothetical protein BGZ72_004397 [Mortierella alpina]
MAQAPTYTVRDASEADVPGINVIVNHEIAVSVSNFNYGPRSEEAGLAWFRSTIDGGYPILVAVTAVEGKEQVAGYASLCSFRQKDGYRFISGGNDGSLRLANEFGFRVVGTMRENGFKFDKWIDNTFVELILD